MPPKTDAAIQLQLEARAPPGTVLATEDTVFEQTHTPPPRSPPPQGTTSPAARINVDKSIPSGLASEKKDVLRRLLVDLHQHRLKWIRRDFDTDAISVDDLRDFTDTTAVEQHARGIQWWDDPISGWYKFDPLVCGRIDEELNVWVLGMTSDQPIVISPFFDSLTGEAGKREPKPIKSRVAFCAQILGARRIPNSSGGAVLCTRNRKFQYTGLGGVDFLTNQKAIDLLNAVAPNNRDDRLIEALEKGNAWVSSGIHNGGTDSWRFNVSRHKVKEQLHIRLHQGKGPEKHNEQQPLEFGGFYWLPHA